MLWAIGALLLAYVVLVPQWRYLVHRWEVTDAAVYTQTGWWARERRIAPMSRVQTVDHREGAIARLFLVASPTTIGARQLAKSLAPERPLLPTGRPLTLGERKWLARTHDRQQLLLLLRDPHPAVVAILLDNPHVTESDVVRVASARPAVPAALTAIAAHPRWSVRHPVKRALVLNPSTPLADAIRIATTLRQQELRELAADPSLREPLRVHAGEVYAAALRRPRA